MPRSILVAILGAGLLNACTLPAPLTTRAFVPGDPAAIEGVIYHLPRSFIRVKASETNLTIVAVENIPDLRARYVLQQRFRASSTDNPEFTTENGMLKTVNADSTDDTPKIVNTALAGVAQVLQREAREAARIATAKIGETEFLVDPFDPHSRGQGEIKVTVTILDPALKARMAQRVQRSGCAAGASLCVAVPTLVRITAAQGETNVTVIVPVADPTLSVGLKLDRHACVATQNAITFTDGFLTKYDVTKPSEVAECLSIPLDILSAIIRAPIDAITGRKARLSAEQSLIAAQVLLAQEQAKLAKLQAVPEDAAAP